MLMLHHKFTGGAAECSEVFENARENLRSIIEEYERLDVAVGGISQQLPATVRQVPFV